MVRKSLTFCSISLLLVAASTSFAKDPAATMPASKPAAGSTMDAGHGMPGMDPKMMEMMAKAMTPGPEHSKIAEQAGDWTLVIKSWMAPGQPPMESKGTAKRTMVLGGRYLQETMESEMMGQKFSGMGLFGYDNVLKRYSGVWMDSMSTGMMTYTGQMNAAGTEMVCHGESGDPMTGKVMKSRMVDKMMGPDKHMMEMFGPGPDGKEMKMMEITFDRKK